MFWLFSKVTIKIKMLLTSTVMFVGCFLKSGGEVRRLWGWAEVEEGPIKSSY